MVRLVTFTLFYLLAFSAHADDRMVVVVNANNPTDSLTKSQLIGIYMGKYESFPEGGAIKPLDNAHLRHDFYQRLISKSLPQVNAYWSRIKFTGRDTNRPINIDTEDKLIAELSSNKEAIAYLPKERVGDQMKVIYELD